MSGYSFDLTRAGFLVLLIAVAPVLWWARSSLSGIGRGRMAAAIALRSLALILIVLALSGMRILRENERLCVIFVVDASDSIPPEHRQLALDQIREAQKRRDEARGDLVGLVIFGRDAGVEIVPRPAAIDLRDFATLIQPEATNIQDAIQLAVTAFPEDAGGRRLVLFTDGNQNIGQAFEEVRSARSLGITVDVVP
ncbi:MAG: VWA domain-containing protein, partial [Planctomycetes bacterium]|nr:VWA domain-containing protein [Planctomycetota bacterium]